MLRLYNREVRRVMRECLIDPRCKQGVGIDCLKVIKHEIGRKEARETHIY